MIEVKAPATIANFGPGFDVFGIALKEPCDGLRVRITNEERIKIKVSGAPQIPTRVMDNTAGLSAIHFLKKIADPCGLEIEIRKGIRPCGGLGSSGASAAGAAFALDRAFHSNLSKSELAEIASKGEVAAAGVPHADNVSPCLFGGFTFIKSSDPLEVECLSVSPIPLVICTPLIPIPTKISRRGIPESIGITKVKQQVASASLLIRGIMAGDLGVIGEAVSKDFLSEPARSKLIPGYKEIKRKALESGAYGCNISGGGPSIFALCERSERKEIGNLMKEGFAKKGIESEVIETETSNLGVG